MSSSVATGMERNDERCHVKIFVNAVKVFSLKIALTSLAHSFDAGCLLLA